MPTTSRALATSAALVLAVALGACDAAKEQPAAPAGGAETGGQPNAGGDASALRAAYDRGLDFLAKAQKDGKFEVQGAPHVGVTALAVAPFLNRPGGRRASDTFVDASLAWIASKVGPDGSVEAEFSSNYETSAAILALAASRDAQYRPVIDRAAAYIKKLQYAEQGHPSYGGIGYGDDGPRSDLSNTYYSLASLKAAGVSPDDPVFQRALVFLGRVQNRKENETAGEPTQWKGENGEAIVRGDDGGGYYYPGESKAGTDALPDGTHVLRSYGSMTYTLLGCYHMAGLDRSDPRVAAAVEWVSKHWAVDRNPGMPPEQARLGLYYYYAAIGKTLPEVGLDTLETPSSGKVDWRAELSKTLLAAQRPDGSWANDTARWMEADPVLATAYALTALRGCER